MWEVGSWWKKRSGDNSVSDLRKAVIDVYVGISWKIYEIEWNGDIWDVQYLTEFRISSCFEVSCK